MAYSVSYVYKIVDQYSAKLGKIDAVTRRFSATMAKARAGMKRTGQRLTSMQGALTSVVSVMGAAGIGRTFVDFDTSMNRLSAVTLAGTKQMAEMRSKAKELGKTTQFSASQVSGAMVYLAQAGLNTDKILEAIPGTLQLAAAGSLDLASAADIATNVVAQMGFEVKDLSRVNDVLALTQARANTNITELFEAMKPVAVTAKNLGIELEELTASLGAMANAGEKGGIAGTLLRNALTRIAAPGSKQIAIYRKMGVNMQDFITKSGKIKNFTGFIDKLKEADKAGKLTVKRMQTLFGERGFRAIQTLVGTSAGAISNLNDQLKNAGGTAEKMALIQMRGLPGVLKSLTSAWEALQIALFESGFAELVIDITNKITEFVRRMVTVNPALLKVIAVVGALAVALGPILFMAGMLATVISALMSPITLVVVGIAALVAVGVALYSKSANIRDALNSLWEALKKVFSPLKPAIYLFKLFFRSMGGGSGVIDAIAASIKAIAIMIDIITKPVQWLVAIAMKLLKSRFVQYLLKKMGFAVEETVNIKHKMEQDSAALSGVSKQSLAESRAQAMRGTLNGTINVAAEKGTSIRNASMHTDMPGNLGFNMGLGGA